MSTSVVESSPLTLSSPAGRWVVATTVLASGMAMLDGTVVNLALPRIGDDLDASFTDLSWILNGYTLSLAALILLGGALGDHLGRRRVFLVGATWFTIASLLCAIAPTAMLLVLARVAQGIGAALMTPGSLSILQASFRRDDRAEAIGLWSGLGGVAAAVGPFVGGWLVDAATWRWIFLLNVPLGAAVLVIGRRHVPETVDPDAGSHLDLIGTTLGALALAGLTWGLTERRWLVVVVGVALGVALVVAESKLRDPLLPLGIFASRTFAGTNVVTVLLYGAMGVVFFLLGLVLQGPLGYSPLRAGAATIPITVLMLALSAPAGRLGTRIGPRIPMTVGPLLVAAGMAWMTTIEPGTRYATGILPPVLVFGLGLTLTVAPLTATALAAVDDHHAGVASGVNNAVARTGQLLAVAAVPVIAGFVPGEVIGGEQLTDGFHTAMWAAAGMAALAAVVSWTTVRRPDLTGTSATAESAECVHCATGGPPPSMAREPAAATADAA
ncbi:MAG: MFS transporter [Ilumatobacteraceae bacterium]